MSDWDELERQGLIVADLDIGALSTYKLGGSARWAATVGTVDALISVVSAAMTRGVDVMTLGRGSNIVVSDDGFNGLVLRLEGIFRDLNADDEGVVTVGAAVPLPHLARTAAHAGLGGVEFYVGIPGSVGGAVVMNAGFAGGETAEVLVAASVLDCTTGDVVGYGSDDLRFGYRTSSIGATDVVLTATFQLHVADTDASLARMREVTQWRKERQPGGTFNAGSVFKNPEGDHAGRLIDDLGLKGHTMGGVSVSDRHANFFVASTSARAQDVYDLMDSVRSQVHEATGVLLEPEIRFVGSFRQRSEAVE